MSHTPTYRLGIDLGTNSLGYALVELKNGHPSHPIHMGVRIFSDGRDPKAGTSLAVDRRTARGMRRRQDRYVRRRQQVMEALIAIGLMPQDRDVRKKLELRDPYTLRAKGLDEQLTLHELGRVLFHLNQRRGFKSNRKQPAKDKESGAIKEATVKLQKELKEKCYRTYGEFLYHQNGGKRIRNAASGSNKTLYDFYPLRSILEDEFDLLATKQAEYYPEVLTTENIKRLKGIIFHQRPLKPVQKGRCSLLPDEERAYSALPSSQRFRVLKEVNNLTLMDKQWRRNSNDLNDEQRNAIIQRLYRNKTVSFDGLRKLLKLDNNTVFNLESDHRDKLGGATTHIILSKKEYFGSLWETLPLDRQDEIVGRLLDDAMDDDVLEAWLREHYPALTAEQVQTIIVVSLDDGTMRYSSKAIEGLIPYLEQGSSEYDAILACGWQGNTGYTGELVDKLPYYGQLLEKYVAFGSYNPDDGDEKRYGKIANPTVHIGLNQLRKVVNELMEVYGRPTEVSVELSRDLKLSLKEKAECNKEIARNTKANERYDAAAQEVGVSPNTDTRLRQKLWEQQEGKCAYSGEKLCLRDVLSSKVEIDHILPFSRTFDDSNANKVIVLTQYNRIKGNLSPYEARTAFTEEGVDYEELLVRIQGLPGSKKWRFLPDAMQRFEEDRDSGDKGWLARQLTDNAYLARVAREYLRYIVGDRVKGFPAVDTYPGGVTAKLRRGWGWNALLPNDPKNQQKEKNRTDHRHHAIDALVIACANRSLLQQISQTSAKNEKLARQWYSDLLEEAPPFNEYNHTSLQQMVDKIIISHKPDHNTPGVGGSGGTSGRLHEDTSYGLAYNQEELKKGQLRLVVRKPLLGLKEKDIHKICDPVIRRNLAYAVDCRLSGQTAEDAIAAFSTANNIGRVRLFEEKSRKAMRAIKDRAGEPYRYVATGSNEYIDIFCPIIDSVDNDGKKYKAGKWYGEAVPTFDANQKGFEPRWRKQHPTAKRVMRLYMNDMVAYEEGGKTEIRRVKKIDGASQRAYLTPHLVASEEGDKQSWAASANKLQEKNARKIAVTPAGKVWDPGYAPMPKPFRKTNDKEATS